MRPAALPLARMLRRIARESAGATLVEFAFVAPVLVLMIFGLFDIAHTQYSASILNGALQKAGRDITLQSAATSETAIDDRVREQIQAVMPPSSTITFQKLSQFDFSDVNAPEDYTDLNNNGRCDNNEPYTDSNNNGGWDRNRGRTGIGGARDVVVYQATVTYPRLFPLFTMIGMSQNITLTSATVLRNQPFAQQAARTTTVRNCTP
jgi:Flp pilus assembly protein TadG